MSTAPTAREVRSRLNHPIIDADGHHLEYLPALDKHLRLCMGDAVFSRWLAREQAATSSLAERSELRKPQPGWWTATPVTHPYDRAAAALPRLLRERMDALGIDFMILYTSVGLRALVETDDAIRIAFCQAYNQFLADHYLIHSDRLTPAGLIPMATPEEAINEIDRCSSLGLKAVHLPHGIQRPVPAIHKSRPELFPTVHWLDTYGLDSVFDYDPVWRHLAHRGYAATFHGHSAHAATARSSRSISNYVFNHIGAHAALMTELCKSLLLGGVTNRFELPFAFLEGGVHWACGLLIDFIEHWERRNATAVYVHDPRRLDRHLMQDLLRTWGVELVQPQEEATLRWFYANRREGPDGDWAEPQHLDDFRACGIEVRSDIEALFSNLYFGTTGSDHALSTVFSLGKTLGIALKPMFSTDYGHWDVGAPDQLLTESFHFVENGALSTEQFRQFTVCWFSLKWREGALR